MSFDQYYQDELAYLREMGEVFSNVYPKLAPYLSQQSQDPDVERLLEGFAFMAGKIRQKLDDQLPEISQELHSLLWPNLLRPVPSCSILAMKPNSGSISRKTSVKKGAEVYSKQLNGSDCTFRTCYDVDLYPMEIQRINLENTGVSSTLNISIRTHDRLSVSEIDLNFLRFCISGDNHTNRELYLHLFRYLRQVSIELVGEKNITEIPLGNDAIKQVGFHESEELTPYPKNAFVGYRLLQEYFSYPQKFLFFDLDGLDNLPNDSVYDEINIKIVFDKKLDDPIRINDSCLKLYCTPIVNLFSEEADPIRMDFKRSEYLVRPSNNRFSDKEVFSVDSISALDYGGKEKINYFPFVSFDNTTNIEGKKGFYYQNHLRPSVSGGIDNFVSFIIPEESEKSGSTAISIELTCTNGNTPSMLGVGDVFKPSGQIPSNVEINNIYPPSPSVPAPLGRDLQWQLISNMSLNYLSLADANSFKTILATYNFQAFYDRQALRAHQLRMEGITHIELKGITKLFKGVPIRGNKIYLEMKSEKFSGEGEMFLFCTVINEFMSLYATVNSFNQLFVKDSDKGEIYQWKAKLGNQLKI